MGLIKVRIIVDGRIDLSIIITEMMRTTDLGTKIVHKWINGLLTEKIEMILTKENKIITMAAFPINHSSELNKNSIPTIIRIPIRIISSKGWKSNQRNKNLHLIVSKLLHMASYPIISDRSIKQCQDKHFQVHKMRIWVWLTTSNKMQLRYKIAKSFLKFH